MANIIGGGDMPQGPQQPRVDISNSTALVCKECGYDVFIGGMKFRKLSKLAFGGDKDMIIPFEVLLCGECGEINDEMMPPEIKALETKDKLKATPKIQLDTND
jgi:DNA-directed RNA polymerase subunit RPC12/RpoP